MRVTTKDLITKDECMDFTQTKAFLKSIRSLHYVYFLIDPFTFQIKYVGKGVGQRCLHHWNKDTKNNKRKQSWLNKLDRKDKTYLIAIWEVYTDEILAFQQENNFIYMLGRKGIDRDGTVFNLQLDTDKHFRSPTKTTKEFVSESIAIHGAYKYDYSESVYIDALSLVRIKCLKCNKYFEHYPNEHKRTQNCPNCAVFKNKGKDNFIRLSKEVHGDIYDYSKVHYINAQEDVCIVCPIHGEFWQRANHHRRGHGCSKCGNSKKDKF